MVYYFVTIVMLCLCGAVFGLKPHCMFEMMSSPGLRSCGYCVKVTYLGTQRILQGRNIADDDDCEAWKKGTHAIILNLKTMSYQAVIFNNISIIYFAIILKSHMITLKY